MRDIRDASVYENYVLPKVTLYPTISRIAFTTEANPDDIAVFRRRLVDCTSSGFCVPQVYYKQYYSIEAAIHHRVVRVRSKEARRNRAPPPRFSRPRQDDAKPQGGAGRPGGAGAPGAPGAAPAAAAPAAPAPATSA